MIQSTLAFKIAPAALEDGSRKPFADPQMTITLAGIGETFIETAKPTLVTMDLKTGEETTRSYDWDAFEITTTNGAVRYDPQYHVLWAQTPYTDLDIIEEGEVVITWKGDNGCLAFSTVPIQYTIPFRWNKILPGGYQIFLITGTTPSWIEYNGGYNQAPNYDWDYIHSVLDSRWGYRFTHWTDASGQECALPDIMPTPDSRATYYYANWERIPVEYTVDRYYEAADGASIPEGTETRQIGGQIYVYQETTTHEALVGDYITGDDYTPDEGFHSKAGFQETARLQFPDTTLECYYDWETHLVSFLYYAGDTADPENLVAEYNGRYPYGATVTAPEITPPDGYHMEAGSVWTGSDGTSVAPGGTFVLGNRDVVYTATLAPDTDIPYRVEHYVQQEDGTYTLADTDFMVGTTGETAAVEQNQYENCGLGTYTAAAVNADGSTVIKVRYTRDNLHTATFQEAVSGRIWGRTCFTAGEPGKEAISSFPQVPDDSGTPLWYWLDEENRPQYGTVPETMPDENITFYLTWNAGGDIPYQVEHYLQNADGSYPSQPAYIDSLTGIAGGAVTVIRPEDISSTLYEAGRYDTTATIAASGATVVRVEYPRTEYTLAFDLNTPDSSASFAPDVSAAVQVRWGAALSLLSTGDVQREGYGLAGWASQNGETVYNSLSEMPPADLTVYAQWEAGVGYTVRHYLQSTDADGSWYFVSGDEGTTTWRYLNNFGAGLQWFLNRVYAGKGAKARIRRAISPAAFLTRLNR